MKNRKNRSIIWSISTEKFKQVILNSKSMAEVCRYFSLNHTGGNYRTLKKRIEFEKIDTKHFLNHGHFVTGNNSKIGRAHV